MIKYSKLIFYAVLPYTLFPILWLIQKQSMNLHTSLDMSSLEQLFILQSIYLGVMFFVLLRMKLDAHHKMKLSMLHGVSFILMSAYILSIHNDGQYGILEKEIEVWESLLKNHFHTIFMVTIFLACECLYIVYQQKLSNHIRSKMKTTSKESNHTWLEL